MRGLANARVIQGLAIKHRTGGGELHQRRNHGEWDRKHQNGEARQQDVDRPLDPGIEALERHIVDADDRQAVQILEARAKRNELQQIRDDLDLDTFAAGELHQVEELGMLLEGQRHIQMIDTFTLRDLANLGERAEEG